MAPSKPQRAPRWAPRWPQESSKRGPRGSQKNSSRRAGLLDFFFRPQTWPLDGPRMADGPKMGPKMAPRELQEGPTRFTKKLEQTSRSAPARVVFFTPVTAPRWPLDGPRMADGPKQAPRWAPRWPQESSKRAPRGSQIKSSRRADLLECYSLTPVVAPR